ncbi:hypothetical protein EMPS_07321 [Entomortierella parvispora]|uniref:F-box domain-containing protein n=1 Tax=Entomortierella parvispora TaxID=205924 RepID=A0A9P3LYC0_9FUNG|nr:hypothetical protein EMPS_07321 [Entomortierella parvispora]
MTGKRLSNDKRVPVEIWEKIFSDLYPSQLSRLSRVSKTLYAIVASLPIWIRLFELTHPNKALRLLQGRSSSICCMIYMCAISLHFCEACQKLIPFRQEHSAKLPLPVLVTLPSTPVRTTITTGKVDSGNIVGNMINLNWRIRKCLGCRDATSTYVVPECLPPAGPYRNETTLWRLEDWMRTYPQLKYTNIVVDINNVCLTRQILEPQLISYMNGQLGGPVGVEAAKSSIRDYDAKTWTRILWYQCQD